MTVTQLHLDERGLSEMVRLHSGSIALPILGIQDVAIGIFSTQISSGQIFCQFEFDQGGGVEFHCLNLS